MTESPRGRRVASRLAANLLLAGAALLATLLACELVLRAIEVGYPVYVWTDPLRGIAHIPGAKSKNQYQGRSWIEINRDGMRGPEIPLEHPRGTLRIALLGDSFIEAFEVPFQKTVGEVVARRLSALRGAPVEVLNFGTGGNGTTQELLTATPGLEVLTRSRAAGGHYRHDIADNYRPLSRDAYRPYYVFRESALVLDTTFLRSKAYRSRALWTRRLLGVVQESRLVQVVNRVRHTSRKSERQRQNAGGAPGDEVGLLDEVQLPPTTPQWREAWRVTEGVFQLMGDECQRRQTPFAIVTLSRGIQVTPVRELKEKFQRQIGAPDLYYPERRIADFGRRQGIPVLNLAPEMARQAEERQVYFHAFHDSVGIGHWNEAGHEAAGELIASWLADQLPGWTAAARRP